MKAKLPKNTIPNCSYRMFEPGFDLPSWFYYGLKAIDNDFHIVWSPYRTLYEDFINQYEGSIDDPRYYINSDYNRLSFGFVLTDNIGNPLPDNSWRVWRWCEPVRAYAHILKIDDDHDYYLRLILKRLYLQAKYTDRYGHRAWNRKLEEEQNETAEIRKKDQENLQHAMMEENSWLVKRAGENLLSGKVAPTNPTVEKITSYPGQTNRTKIERPLTDDEAGLVY